MVISLKWERSGEETTLGRMISVLVVLLFVGEPEVILRYLEWRFPVCFRKKMTYRLRLEI